MSNPVIDLLVPDAVLLHQDYQDNKSAIRALSDCLHAAGYVHDTFAGAVLTREATMPTGLPLAGAVNAAIPHADIEHVIKPGLALATLKKPVLFQNMIEPEVGLPVQLVIVMALNQPKAQVEMLMAVAGILQNPSVLEQLLRANTFDEVVGALAPA